MVLVFIFTSANDQVVHVNFLLGEFDGALSFILGMAFIFGFVLALVVLFLLYLVLKTRVVLANNKAHALEKKVQKLELALESYKLDAKTHP
ncbi:LapA family protein [Psittacicella hinzii]|uniref:LapA family protein n=1 Tax=Psittacicella hinzii TaxID=2028575 RepID=UPI001CA784BF|nr:LapA family protein [Psittacicella hinzii]